MNMSMAVGDSVGMHIRMVVLLPALIIGMGMRMLVGVLRHEKRPPSFQYYSSMRVYLHYYTSRKPIPQALPGVIFKKINALTDWPQGAIIKKKQKGAILMHLDHDHVGHGHHDHEHTHDHAHTHDHEHSHDHAHSHDSDCAHDCGSCASQCEHTPMEELQALMKYMVGHNAAHAKELADLAVQLDKAGDHTAYEQVMAAVSDFEKGNMRLSVVLAAMESK